MQEAEEEVSKQLEEAGLLVEEPAKEQPVEEPAPASKSQGEFPESVPVVVGPFGVAQFQVVTGAPQEFTDEQGKKFTSLAARIYGKQGQPISGILPLEIASRTASRHNATDPEQIEARARGKK